MNASNPRTALTTSASRLLALLTGNRKPLAVPGTGRLRLLPLPGRIPDPGLPSGGRHPPGTGRPRFCPAVPGVSLTRKGAAFLHALQTLAAAKGVDLSFSLVYQGREEPLAELSPSTSTCCCTSASGPLCRPGCRSAAPAGG